MDRTWYEGYHDDSLDHRQQPENATVFPKRQLSNTSYQRLQDAETTLINLDPVDTVAFSREDLQSAQWALNCARMALSQPRASQSCPSDMVIFNREGLRSIETALVNVRTALTNPQAPTQPPWVMTLRPNLDNSVKAHNEATNSSHSSYGM